MYFECRHIMPNGARCHSPALHDMNFCYFHNRIQAIAKPSRAKSHSAKAGDEPFKYPILEDRTAIQVALSQIINDLSSSKLDPRRAGILLYAVQIASQNVERKQDILPFRSVDAFSLSSDGEMIAPQLRICEDADLCSTCHLRDTCTEFALPEDSDES